MCGIVGILGREPVADLLVESLKRLEYRGYDSAGIATLEGGRGRLTRRRAEGKLRNLEAALRADPLEGKSGIGHTRWATHGRPTENNAHPHATDRVAVVHNGIIENFRELREELRAKGHPFETETDTEVVAHLVTDALIGGLTPAEAVAVSLPRLRGAFALAFLFDGQENLMIGARQGAPLAVGFGQGDETGTMYLGSDALALAPFTNTLTYLEEGDWVVLTHEKAVFFDENNQQVSRPQLKTMASAFLVDKGNHRHFMAKEIHEQPEVVAWTLGHYLDMSAGRVALPFDLPVDVAALDKLTIAACGTAYMAGLTSKYWFERFARLPVSVEVASEFRYGEVPMAPGGMTILVSQSGETADTLASLRYAKANGQKIVSVVNVESSTMARESHVTARTLAGPEIGVASTKAFTCQLAVLACLALAIGRARGVLSEADEKRLVFELSAVPGLMAEAIKREAQVEHLARELGKVRDVLYLGRGTSFPLAMEGALKLKELSYIHAEGYAAGELKHGPIALIEPGQRVFVIVPSPRDASSLHPKVVSNIQEIRARGAYVLAIAEAGDVAVLPYADEVLRIPLAGTMFEPLLAVALLQQFAMELAAAKGLDVDQPRNLAKSVTVE